MSRQTEFCWPLPDFKKRCDTTEPGERWASDEFELNGAKGASFQLVMIPKSDATHLPFCGLFLKCCQLDLHRSIRLNFQFWLEKTDSDIDLERPIDAEFSVDDERGWPHAALLRKFVFHGLPPLRAFGCKIEVLSTIKNMVTWQQDRQQVHAQKYAHLLHGQRGNDPSAFIEVHVKDRIFTVNKQLVCAQSTHLLNVFSHRMKENEKGVIKIEKFDVEMIERLLQFFHTGGVDGLDERSVEFLSVADYFVIPELIELCLDSIVGHLSLDTCLLCLGLAVHFDQYEDFCQQVWRFAKENAQGILRLDEWTPKFVSENPLVAHKFVNCAFRL